MRKLSGYFLLLSLLLCCGCAKTDATANGYLLKRPIALNYDYLSDYIVTADNEEGTYKTKRQFDYSSNSNASTLEYYDKQGSKVWEREIPLNGEQNFQPLKLHTLPSGECLMVGSCFGSNASNLFDMQSYECLIYNTNGKLINRIALDYSIYASHPDSIIIKTQQDTITLYAVVNSYKDHIHLSKILKQYELDNINGDVDNDYITTSLVPSHLLKITIENAKVTGDENVLLFEGIPVYTTDIMEFGDNIVISYNGNLPWISSLTPDFSSITCYDKDLIEAWTYKNQADQSIFYSQYSIQQIGADKIIIEYIEENNWEPQTKFVILDHNGIVTAQKMIYSQYTLCKSNFPSSKIGLVKDEVFCIMDENGNIMPPIIELSSSQINNVDFFEDYFVIILSGADSGKGEKAEIYNYDGILLWEESLPF